MRWFEVTSGCYKETREIVSFIMTIVGDKEYLEKKEFKLWDNDYIVKDDDFSGLILYHSLEGKFVNGWRYTNGEGITHKVKLDFDMDVKLKLKGSYLDCITVPVYLIEEDCTDHYTSGELPDGSFDWDNASLSYVSCDITSTYVGSIEQCVVVNTDDDSSGYDPDEDPTETMGKIMDTSNLPLLILEALENAFKEVKNNCVGGYVVSKLIENNFKVLISYEPTGYSGTYDPLTNTLTLGKPISFYSTSTLTHELFHALQDVIYPQSIIQTATSGDRNGFCQLEFEAKIVEDLMDYSFINYFGTDDVHTKYDALLNKLKNNELVDIEEFNELLTPFKENTVEYNKPDNPDFTPSLLKNVRENCN